MGVPSLPDGNILPDCFRVGLFGDDALDNLAVLYQAQVAIIEDANKKGRAPSFRLNLFFADILDCFGILTLDNLTRVIGYKNANSVWDEVSPNGCEDKSAKL